MRLKRWERLDSNQRSVTAEDLQSSPFAARDTLPNCFYRQYLTRPTENLQHILRLCKLPAVFGQQVVDNLIIPEF